MKISSELAVGQKLFQMKIIQTVALPKFVCIPYIWCEFLTITFTMMAYGQIIYLFFLSTHLGLWAN